MFENIVHQERDQNDNATVWLADDENGALESGGCFNPDEGYISIFVGANNIYGMRQQVIVNNRVRTPN